VLTEEKLFLLGVALDKRGRNWVTEMSHLISFCGCVRITSKLEVFTFIYTELKNGKHDYDSWSHVFPQFILWADGK